MYIYMGMFFNSQQDVPDFGSIAMYYVGTKDLGYVEEGHKRFRKYTFQSTDLNKLSLITNAIDGSEAFAVDTGITYVLYDGEWSIKSSEITPAKMAEMLGNITQIDYQVVNQLPQTGIKGTIYLVSHETAQGDYYDEYIWTTKVDSSTGENINIYEKIGNTAPTISTMVGATSGTDGVSGLVPAPASHQRAYFLKGDGTWGNTTSLSNIPKNADLNDYQFYFPTNHSLQYYQCNYQNSPFVLNKPSGISDSFILQTKYFFGHRTFTSIQTIYTMSNFIYQRKIYEGSDNVCHYEEWKQIYPIEDFIPKVNNKTGEIPKFKSDGTLQSTGFTLETSVPSNAVFTDTTYNVVTQNTDGLMSSTDKIIIDEIPDTYVAKSDIVICTLEEYQTLTTKTADFYYIIEDTDPSLIN